MAGNVGFGIEIIFIIGMDVEVVGFKMTKYGDVGGFVEIPELETGHFINDDGSFGKIVENIEGGGTDVANEIGVFTMGVEQRFDKGTDGALTLSGSDANDGTGTVFEEVFRDAGFIGKV